MKYFYNQLKNLLKKTLSKKKLPNPEKLWTPVNNDEENPNRVIIPVFGEKK